MNTRAKYVTTFFHDIGLWLTKGSEANNVLKEFASHSTERNPAESDEKTQMRVWGDQSG